MSSEEYIGNLVKYKDNINEIAINDKLIDSYEVAKYNFIECLNSKYTNQFIIESLNRYTKIFNDNELKSIFIILNKTSYHLLHNSSVKYNSKKVSNLLEKLNKVFVNKDYELLDKIFSKPFSLKYNHIENKNNKEDYFNNELYDKLDIKIENSYNIYNVSYSDIKTNIHKLYKDFNILKKYSQSNNGSNDTLVVSSNNVKSDNGNLPFSITKDNIIKRNCFVVLLKRFNDEKYYKTFLEIVDYFINRVEKINLDNKNSLNGGNLYKNYLFDKNRKDELNNNEFIKEIEGIYNIYFSFYGGEVTLKS